MAYTIFVTEDHFTDWAADTGIECHFCEEDTYYEVDHEWVCGTCHTVPHTTAADRSGPWESFWNYRNNLDDDERPYCVGGFHGPYIYDDD